MTSNTFGKEALCILALGFPIIITQVAQASIGFVDTLVAGQYGTLDLAAVALGSSIWIPLFLTFSGVLMITTPLIAQATGGNDRRKIALVFKQGIWIALALSVFAFIALQNAGVVLSLMEVEPELEARTLAYLNAISYGFPGIILYQLLRSYFEGLGKTRPAMYIAIFGLLANIPLNYIFVFGKLGLPEMGAAGCGIASAIVMWMEFVASTVFMRFHPRLKLPRIENVPGFDLNEILVILKLGVPFGFALLIEASMFSVIALLLAPLGTTIVASHQITLTFSGQIFMVPLSIALATTIRVGTLLGSGQPHNAWFSAKTSLVITTGIACVASLSILLLSEEIAGLFTSEAQLISMASGLLIISAFYSVSDAIQVTSAGALRGYKDTSIPLLFVFISYWIVGLPLGYILAMTDWILPRMEAAGFWYGLVIGLTLAAVLLLTRLKKVSSSAMAIP